MSQIRDLSMCVPDALVLIAAALVRIGDKLEQVEWHGVGTGPPIQ
jgi:hypothetical protein